MNGSVGKWATVGFALMIVALLVSGWLSYRNIHQLSVNESWVIHTYEVLGDCEKMLSTLSDAEAGQRGYLITGESSFMRPYRNATVSIQAIVSDLT